MSDLEEDEYDACYSPLDLEGFHSQSPPSRRADSPTLAASAPASQATAPQTSDDEFEAYDFSEFTAADFAQIDAELAANAASYATSVSVPDSDHNGGKPGGPAIEIKLEEDTADHSTLVKAPKPKATPPPSRRDTRSPFKRFRNWNKYFSVSDLVGPSWCEVQFDYGLRQKRWLKPEERPDTFVTEEGKTITVDKGVAVQNFRTATRGQSVHKVLEREVKPEEILVEITTPEERWGIRLVNMLACLDMLIESGLCREMPVFGIVHDQIVVGIIDELVRKPAPPSTPDHKRRRGRPPGSGKGLNKRASPSTPTKGNRKKSRTTPETNQPPLTSYFHMAVQVPEREGASSAFAVRTPAGTRHATPSEVDPDADSDAPRGPAWMLHISDTKTRRTASLPPAEDTLSARLQLMLYHRLLSSLLQPAAPSAPTARKPPGSAPPADDFAAIWTRLGLDARKPFSTRFVCDAGLAPGACLADLVQTWHHTAAALDVGGVDRTLTLVYRLQPAAARQIREREKAEREGAELARAIEASLNAAPRAWAGGDEDLARAIEASMREVKGQEGSVASIGGALPDVLAPSAEELDGVQDTVPHAPVTVHEGAARDASRDGSEDEEDEVQITAAELDVEARILGLKEFAADDQALDSYLDSVLQWWLGERPPKGVDIELTRRCLTCEYVDGCEWRAKKALEHQQQAASRT